MGAGAGFETMAAAPGSAAMGAGAGFETMGAGCGPAAMAAAPGFETVAAGPRSEAVGASPGPEAVGAGPWSEAVQAGPASEAVGGHEREAVPEHDRLSTPELPTTAAGFRSIATPIKRSNARSNAVPGVPTPSDPVNDAAPNPAAATELETIYYDGPAMLIRPDGHVAWVEASGETALKEAIARWC